MRRERLADALVALEPYAYRKNTRVPRFDDSRPLIVFDGVCVLCSGFARFVLRQDTRAQFRLTTAQSILGRALLEHHGVDPDNPETNLLLLEGRGYGKLDALVAILQRLEIHRGVRRLVRLCPGRLADWVYDRIAQDRYALSGRRERCMVAPPEWADRIL